MCVGSYQSDILTEQIAINTKDIYVTFEGFTFHTLLSNAFCRDN